jgi:hypothetical protein
VIRFLLTLRPIGGDETLFVYRSSSWEPRLEGRPVVAGETYHLRGRDWVVELDEIRDGARHYVCTPSSGLANPR